MRGFNERVIRWEVPQALDKADIEAVAWAMFPDATRKDIAAMVHVTMTARGGSLHFLETIRRSVAFVAGRSPVTAEHVREAISNYAVPHANALASALTTAQKKAGRKFIRKPAVAVPAPAPRAERESLAAPARTPRDTAPALGTKRETAPKGFEEVPG